MLPRSTPTWCKAILQCGMKGGTQCTTSHTLTTHGVAAHASSASESFKASTHSRSRCVGCRPKCAMHGTEPHTVATPSLLQPLTGGGQRADLDPSPGRQPCTGVYPVRRRVGAYGCCAVLCYPTDDVGDEAVANGQRRLSLMRDPQAQSNLTRKKQQQHLQLSVRNGKLLVMLLAVD